MHVVHSDIPCQWVAVLAVAGGGGCQPAVLACAEAASLGLPVLLHQALLGCQCKHLEDGRLLQLAANLQQHHSRAQRLTDRHYTK